MAWSFVSVTGCLNLGASTKCSYNLHTNPTSGNAAIISVSWQSTTATATVSCTNNTTWNAVGSPSTGGGFSGQMFYIQSLVTGANPEQCAVTISASVGFMSWNYAEYSFGSAVTLDGTPLYSTTPASGGVATISGLTTSDSSDVLHAACIGVSSTCTAGTGFTGRNDTNSCSQGTSGNCSGGTTGNNFNSLTGGLLEDKLGVAAGAQTATFGTGATDAVTLGLIAFGQASITPPTIPQLMTPNNQGGSLIIVPKPIVIGY